MNFLTDPAPPSKQMFTEPHKTTVMEVTVTYWILWFCGIGLRGGMDIGGTLSIPRGNERWVNRIAKRRGAVGIGRPAAIERRL
jgi:hypothetical protein